MSTDPKNGVMVLSDDDRSPVVGPRRARITRPLTEPPAYSGRWGCAWVCDLASIRRGRPFDAPPDATIAHWIIEAPWSSEVVHSYSLAVVHLRSVLGIRPPTLLIPGASHEMALIAINPGADRAAMIRNAVTADQWLQPQVFGAQLAEPSDEAAAIRVARAGQLVCDGRLSPHPTHIESWIELFGGNMCRDGRALTVRSGEETN